MTASARFHVVQAWGAPGDYWQATRVGSFDTVDAAYQHIDKTAGPAREVQPDVRGIEARSSGGQRGAGSGAARPKKGLQ